MLTRTLTLTLTLALTLTRRCLMAHTAIELFRDDGDTLMLNLPDKAMRSRVRRWIKRKY